MKTARKNRLEAHGWKVGSPREFLKLSPGEAAYVEMKITLGRNLRDYRRQKKLTQHDLARLLKSSQSRIAKIEAGDPSVSLDLVVRSLLTLGASPKSLARMLS
jgi:DNA-binding XRE family transcriptional regulator